MNRSFLLLSATLMLSGSAWIRADQLLERGGFEIPMVQARTSLAQGGSPTRQGGDINWLLFVAPKPQPNSGSINAGLTNEIARSGKQSLFIEFSKFKALNSGVTLASELLSVLPSQHYRTAIWGRVDAKNPLTFDQRIPFLKLTIEFYLADKENQTGEPIYRLQPMPDSKVRLGNRPPLFSADRWTEYFVDLETPADAAFLKLTWGWASTKLPGETTGVIFFDDATLEGPAGPKPPQPVQPNVEPTSAAVGPTS